ncbi:hypothetical protein [Phaeovulum sp. W22_SRMD_FR3]|uniref:hypothetical protein n=1 Tax=Phaeovulum sp. W22_SRMD_FR3 TaxID=3240274 RepID=UPI003F9D7812
MNNPLHRTQFAAPGVWAAPQSGGPDLRALSQQLQNVHGRTELVFLSAGRDLVNLTAQFDCIEEPLLDFGNLVDAGQISTLAQNVGTLDLAMSELTTALTTGITWVGELGTTAHQLQAEVGDMARIVRTMTIVALNARVTVAALTGRHSGLEVFTKSASELVAKAANILWEMQEAVVDMVATADQARGVGEVLHRMLDQSLPPVVQGLGGDLIEMQSVTQNMHREGRDLSGASQKLRATLSAAAAGLQIGDTTRQRLEHILEIVSRSMTGTSGAVQTVLLMLVSDQLEDCRADHAQGLAQIGGSLAQARGQIAGFLGRDSSLSEAVRACKRENGLLSKIRDLQHSTEECRRARLRLAGQAAELSQGLAHLSGVVAGMRTVEEQMRMIGINAVISCANLGTEGHALKEISVQLRELAGAISGRFDKIYASLKRMDLAAGSATAQLAEAAQTPFDRLEATAAQMVEDLHHVQRVMARLAEAFGSIATVENARQWDITTGALADHAAQVDQAALLLAEVVDAAVPCTPEHLAAGLRELQKVQSLYTMAAERRCHSDFLARLGLAAPEPAPAAAAPTAAAGDASVDDVFF